MEQENMAQEPVVETTKTFDEVLKDSNYQSEFDKRVAKALETSKAKWVADYEAKKEAEKTEAQKVAKMDAEQKLNYQLEQEIRAREEAQAKLNAYELKEQAIKIAGEKDIPVGYLELIDFSKTNADNLLSTLDKLKDIRSKDIQSYIKEKVKEPSPTTVSGGETKKYEIPSIF